MPSSPRFCSALRLLVLTTGIASLAGCGLFRGGSSTQQRLDEPREIPHHPANVKPRTMLIEITTDASGAVATVEFKRSSGSAAVDNFVAENIRHTWPGGPSTRSLVELTYSADKSFSEPKLISATPVP